MDGETFELLEFNQVIEMVAALAQSPLGRKAVRAMRPLRDPDQISRRQASLTDVLRFLEESPRIGCSHLEDPRDLLETLELKTRPLESVELLRILEFLELGEAIRRVVRAGKLPTLGKPIASIALPAGLKHSICSAIGPEGEILDSAHPDLARNRRMQEKLRRKLDRQLRGFFQTYSRHLISDPFVTQRAGRFVIPVRAESRHQIPGIVHGTSSSGATVFLEPLSAMELNNELVRAADQEDVLVRQVLQRLTKEASGAAEALKQLVDLAGLIDAFFACGEFHRRYDCTIPQIEAGTNLSLRDACHPLLLRQLSREAVVPITIELDSDHRVLVISGPNTGGKTAALKTAGLLVLMGLTGLPVPARDAVIPLAEGVFADIGDHQSITQQLSTFSAHIKRIRSLSEAAGHSSLLLLDELGRGTDPLYGSVLAVAAIDHFFNKGCWILTTTHHRLVKSFAGSTPGIRNAAVRLDPATHQPTYSIEPNSTGHSSGLEIAGQLGLSPAIINKARSLLDPKELEVEQYLETLREQLSRLRAEEKEIKRKLQELEADEIRRKAEFQRREKQRQQEFEIRLKKWAEEFDRDAKRLLKRIRDRLAAAETRRQVELRREQLKEEYRRKAKDDRQPTAVRGEPPSLAAGDPVFHRFFRKKGSVVSVGANAVRVDIEGKIVSAKPGDLSKIETKNVTRSPDRAITLQVVESTEPELNLIGHTVEDALPVIDKFIDRAFVSHLKEVRVIHGFGTGRLKAFLCEFLKEHPQVDRFETEGGSTRVFLRD